MSIQPLQHHTVPVAPSRPAALSVPQQAPSEPDGVSLSPKAARALEWGGFAGMMGGGLWVVYSSLAGAPGGTVGLVVAGLGGAAMVAARVLARP